jgi:hypothetical protein
VSVQDSHQPRSLREDSEPLRERELRHPLSEGEEVGAEPPRTVEQQPLRAVLPVGFELGSDDSRGRELGECGELVGVEEEGLGPGEVAETAHALDEEGVAAEGWLAWYVSGRRRFRSS